MRILLIPENYPTDDQPVGGVFMEDQVKALARVGEVTVFNTNPWNRGNYLNLAFARYYDFHLFQKKWPPPFNLAAYSWWEYQSFQIAKKLTKPDIIHLHGATLRGKMAVKLAAHWKVPLVITEHTGPWSAIAERSLMFRKAKFVMESADFVLPVSSHLAGEIFQSGINPSHMEALGNPVDTDFFGLRKTPLYAAKKMLFLGRLDEFKGGLRALKAFHHAKERLSGWTLTIAGQGKEADAIQDYIVDNHLGSDVNFDQGFFNRIAMREYFHKASFLICPSRFESFGLVGAEAMATGLPVLITDRTGPKDYFLDGCGMQTDPDNIDAIAKGMVAVAQKIENFDPEYIRNHIVARFGLEKYANTLGQIYSGLISNPASDNYTKR